MYISGPRRLNIILCTLYIPGTSKLNTNYVHEPGPSKLNIILCTYLDLAG